MVEATTAPGRYVDAGGVRTYYEIHGAGEPLILLHGGLCTIETFEAQTTGLSTSYEVYLPERRGHGRTPDVEGPFTFEAMGDDTIAYLEALGLGPVPLVGWSDGAEVALLVALRRPDLVSKLVLIGQPTEPAGARPELQQMLASMTRESFPPMFEQMYGAVSPDGPDHFAVVFDKVLEMWRTDRGVPPSACADVEAPTLFMIADDDLVSIEHASEVVRALPDAQLAIVPGTSHALPMEKPDLVNRMITDFLAAEQTAKLFAVHGAPDGVGT